MRNSTLLFLIKKSASNAKSSDAVNSSGTITHLCLAMKKRGFGAGRWNGVGGKVKEGESIEMAAIRETEEEIGVKIGVDSAGVPNLYKAAELEFKFANRPEWDQLVHVYLCEKWQGEPIESEEMSPKWFAVEDIPYGEMWPDDPFWLPQVIAGAKKKDSKVKGYFTFGDGDVILKKRVEEVREPQG